MDFTRTISQYMTHCRSRQLRPKTMSSYEQTLALFALWMEQTHSVNQVEAIREAHIRQYIIDLQSRGKYTFCTVGGEKSHPQNRRDYQAPISNITINNYLRNLKAFFAWAVEMEYISKSPMKRIHPLPEERKPREYLEDEEVKRLLRSFDRGYYTEYRDLLVILLMLDSGTRLGETLSIEMDQLDLLDRCVVLPADKTKGRRTRTVYFSEKTAKEMRRWIQYKDRYCESDFLFPVRRHGRKLEVSVFERNFRQYIKRVGITKAITPHTMRNNFAKRCLMAGMDIYTLSRILGHSSVEVTEKAYLDLTDSDIKKKYNRFSPVEGIYYGQG